jgi:hypothetical protein
LAVSSGSTQVSPSITLFAKTNDFLVLLYPSAFLVYNKRVESFHPWNAEISQLNTS